MSESVYDPVLGRHGPNCSCHLCKRYHAGDDITKEPSQQDQVRQWIKEQKEKKPPLADLGMDYREDSLVFRQKDRIKELVDAHWSFMEKVLSTGQDKQQTFTWDQVMQIRKWDYTSSAIHFYGHGYEDAGKEEIQQRTQICNEMFVKLKGKDNHGSE